MDNEERRGGGAGTTVAERRDGAGGEDLAAVVVDKEKIWKQRQALLRKYRCVLLWPDKQGRTTPMKAITLLTVVTPKLSCGKIYFFLRSRHLTFTPLVLVGRHFKYTPNGKGHQESWSKAGISHFSTRDTHPRAGLNFGMRRNLLGKADVVRQHAHTLSRFLERAHPSISSRCFPPGFFRSPTDAVAPRVGESYSSVGQSTSTLTVTETHRFTS